MASASAADADNQINGATAAVDAAEDTVDSSYDVLKISALDADTESIGAVSQEKDSANNILQATNNEILKDNEENGTFTDLNTLIASKVSGDTIVLEKNYVYNSSEDSKFSSSGITISKSITIDGQGKYSITGNNYIFTVDADNVHLKNLKFENSSHVIIWNGDDGEIDKCVFTRCQGFNIYGSKLVINNTRFINKTDMKEVLTVYNSNLKILNSNFTDFYTNRYIRVVAYTTNTLIKNCIFNGTFAFTSAFFF